jgi:trigger factor
MSVQKKAAQGLVSEFTVTVPQNEMNTRIQSWLTQRAKTVKMDGFRPGKVPLHLVEKHYGDHARRAIIEDVINEKTREVIKEHALKPAIQPEFSIAKAGQDEDLVFDLTVENSPEIELKDFKKLNVEVLAHEVTDQEADADIAKLTTLLPTYVDAPKGYKATGTDQVEFDIETTIQGKNSKDYSGIGNRAVVGRNDFGFAEINKALLGAKVGDNVSVSSKFPTNYGDKKVAGREATFNLAVTSVRQPHNSQVDDAFAQRLGYKDLAALKEARLKHLQDERGRLIHFYHKRKVLDALADQYSFEVPPRMVKTEFESIWSRLQAEMTQARQKGELADEDANKPEAELRKEYEEIATRRVRLGLLIADIAQKNNLNVTSQAIAKLVWEEASRYPGQEQQVIDYYRKNPHAQEHLKSPALEEVVISHILAHAQTKEIKVDYAKLKGYLKDVIPGFEEDEANASEPKKAKSSSKKKTD